MKNEIVFENNWNEEDKHFFIEHYLPQHKWLDRIVLGLSLFFFIAIIFGITNMHQKITGSFIIAGIVDVITITMILFANAINKRLLGMVIHKYASVVLKANDVYTDGIKKSFDQAMISHQFIFFRTGRKVLIQRVSEPEILAVLEMAKAYPQLSISQVTKTFSITKFALRKSVY